MVSFGPFRFDPESGELRKHGYKVRLPSQPAQILCALMERPGEVLQDRLWPGATAGDFEHGLNAAVSKLRQALIDTASQPRYIETLPGIGYRFVAPIKPESGQDLQLVPPVPATEREPLLSHQKPQHWMRAVATVRTRAIILALTATVVIAGTVLLFRAKSQESTGERQPPVRLTYTGSAFHPAISADGKLVAYTATGSGSVSQIWVQQIAGGAPLQITNVENGADLPSFSPDAASLLYSSAGRIFETSTLGGPARFLAEGFSASYTADARTVVFQRNVGGWPRLFVMARNGGAAHAVRSELVIPAYALSPDGRSAFVNAARNNDELATFRSWFLISIPGGALSEVMAPAVASELKNAVYPAYWGVGAGAPHKSFVVFTAARGGETGLNRSLAEGADPMPVYRVGISQDGRALSRPERVPLLPGAEFGGASKDGRIVFGSAATSENLWSIPVSPAFGLLARERRRLTHTDGLEMRNLSLSRDGTRALFVSHNRIVFRDMSLGTQRELGDGDMPSISPDGSLAVYTVVQTGEGGKIRNALYAIPTTGGERRKICASCAFLGPKGFSGDGTRVLAQGFDPDRDEAAYIELIDLRSGEVKRLLSLSDRALWHPYFSTKDDWITFKQEWNPAGAPAGRSQIMIAPVRSLTPGAEREWVALTSGEHADEKPQLSPDGKTLYFTSDRDGHYCFWGQRLHPQTKIPVGIPFAVHHIHEYLPYSHTSRTHIETLSRMELTLTPDQIVTNIRELHSDIWMSRPKIAEW